MTLIIFNLRKTIFKNILLKPELKEQFFDSIELSNENLDLELYTNKEYSSDFIFEIMNSQKSVNLTFNNFSSKFSKFLI